MKKDELEGFPQQILVTKEEDYDDELLVVTDGDADVRKVFGDRDGDFVATYVLKRVDRIRVHVGLDPVI